MGSNRRPRASRQNREKRIPGSYIVILQPGVTPYDLLSTVLDGHKPTFTYSSIFNGFAVDRVAPDVAHEVRLDPRVLKVVENRVVSSLNKELLIETLQTKYTVVNRDTGELYDVREIDASMPYRYSVLPHNVKVPNKARRLLGINEHPTHVPPKAARVMGHNPYRQRVSERDLPAGPLPDKAAKMLGIAPMRQRSGSSGGGGGPAGIGMDRQKGGNSNGGRRGNTGSVGSVGGGGGRYGAGSRSRAALDEEEEMERAGDPAHLHGGNGNGNGGNDDDDDLFSDEEVLFDAEAASPNGLRKPMPATVTYVQHDDDVLPQRSWRRHGSQ